MEASAIWCGTQVLVLAAAAIDRATNVASIAAHGRDAALHRLVDWKLDVALVHAGLPRGEQGGRGGLDSIYLWDGLLADEAQDAPLLDCCMQGLWL